MYVVDGEEDLCVHFLAFNQMRNVKFCMVTTCEATAFLVDCYMLPHVRSDRELYEFHFLIVELEKVYGVVCIFIQLSVFCF